MVQSISQQNPNNVTKASIFYVNDAHGNIYNIERLKTASDEFDSFVPSQNVDKLKFSAGDFDLGKNKKLNNFAVAAQNLMGFSATAAGNHEFDLDKKDLIEVLQNNNYKILAGNVEIPETSEENKILNKEVTKAFIQEQNGSQYGIVGVMPFDLKKHLANVEEYKDFNITPIEEYIPKLQQQIDELKEQGINKIIVLSHAGYEADVKFAKEIEGIDVIIGGHTHKLIKGLEEGKNLFYSPKTGEPTIITEAGKDGKYFGVLNLEFNNNGVITKAQNNVTETENYAKSPVMNFFTNMFLGKPNVVGRINSVEPNEKFSYITEFSNANLLTDAMKTELGADISIMNTATVRSKLEQGPVTDRDISALSPFKEYMYTVQVNEKELVDAMKFGAKSMVNPNNRPGIVQFSGITYTMNKAGDIIDANFIDKKGVKTPIDVNNPNQFKTYTAAMGTYMAKGGNGYLPNKLNEASTKEYQIDKVDLAANYIKKMNGQFNLKRDGRVKIID